MTMTHTIHFTRSGGARFDGGFEGFGGDFAVQVRGAEDGWPVLMRAMVDAGVPDAPCVLVDGCGMPCMTVRSLHASARRYCPTASQRAGEREYASWFPRRRG